ncbi:MAG: AtuA-related protein [Gemmatimonadota bacterium]
MAKISLYELAHARSGDKGDTVNVGVIARRPEHYELLAERLTVERVEAHFGDAVGAVERFELPNLYAINFLLHEALGGGGTVSLMTDAQGKTFSTALLRMEVDVPDAVAEELASRSHSEAVPGGESGADAAAAGSRSDRDGASSS